MVTTKSRSYETNVDKFDTELENLCEKHDIQLVCVGLQGEGKERGFVLTSGSPIWTPIKRLMIANIIRTELYHFTRLNVFFHVLKKAFRNF